VLVGAMLVKSVYALPTFSRTARLIAEHDAIGGAPSQWACYRFAAKLREHGDALATCIDSVLAKLRDARPEMGKTVAIDGSDLPAYANGQRYVKRGGEERKKFADPDASWGHRSSISTRSGGGYYGYKVHAAVCTATGLPVAWEVQTAKASELPEVPVLLDEVARRGFKVDIAVLDRGYDAEIIYAEVGPSLIKLVPHAHALCALTTQVTCLVNSGRRPWPNGMQKPAGQRRLADQTTRRTTSFPASVSTALISRTTEDCPFFGSAASAQIWTVRAENAQVSRRGLSNFHDRDKSQVRRPRRASCRKCRCCSMRSPGAASRLTSPCLTVATTPRSSMPKSRTGTSGS
jgi:hypothetical protein